MLPDPDGADRIACYAVVTYITGPLGAFVDQFRREADPSCNLQAHITLLAPRLLRGTPTARKWIEEQVRGFEPFEIEATEVDVFDLTRVIYLAVGDGGGELGRLNRALNSGPLRFAEPFPYCPHITLAQEYDGSGFSESLQLARHRWADFRYPRRFLIDRLTLVEGCATDGWVDLAEFRLVVGA